MSKQLIFGVSGQIGSYMAELLLDKGHQVIGVCRRNSYNNKQRLAHRIGHPSLVLTDGDITDAHSVRKTLDKFKPDIIYNFAAQSQVWTSFEEPEHTFTTIVNGTLNCLEWLKDNPYVRFYHSSSSEMFGNSFTEGIKEGTLTHWHKFQNETTPCHPCSPYAAAKLAAHNLVSIYRKSYGLWACSGITFNSESPRRGEHFVTRKITKWFAANRLNILSGNFQKLRLGNVDSVRDWLHAKDTVAAIYAMMCAIHQKDYVISSGQAHTVRDFVHAVAHKIFKNIIDPETLYSPNDSSFLRPNDLVYLKGDSSLIRKELGWSPSITFEQLVNEMVEHDLYEK